MEAHRPGGEVPHIAPAASPYVPDHAPLLLTGFCRLYEAQLRSEHKRPSTIRIYNDALTRSATRRRATRA